MRHLLASLIAVGCLGALVSPSDARPAQAPAIPQISADAPIAGLPAISQDGRTFARPVQVQPKDCKVQQTFVEVGTVGSAAAPGKGDLRLVADPCGPGKGITGNLDAVNQTLQAGNFRSLGTLEARALPAQLSTAVGMVDVAAGTGNQVAVSVEGSAADRWSIALDGKVTEVRGWYDASNGAGETYVSVLIAVKAKDTGALGRERWVDVWPVGGAGQDAAPGTPTEIGVLFVKSLASRDAEGLADLISAPFWKIGLRPVAGALKRTCKRLDKARRERDLAKVARCMAAGASTFYGTYDVNEAVAEIDMSEFPDELGKRNKKKVAALVKKGSKLVRYHVNQDGLFVYLILVLDRDTDFRTAKAVVEYVDVDANE
jgi:hypothetical protein